MKKNNPIVRFTFMFIAIAMLLIACNKVEDENPTGIEPINFMTPDSTTIFASPSEVVDFTLYLSIDQAIDTIRAGYLVDTAMSVTNFAYSDMEEQFFVQGFNDSLNVQTVSGILTMPAGRTDTTAFRPYFGGSVTPYAAPQYDVVRVIFKMEAEDGTSFEKQLKVIVN